MDSGRRRTLRLLGAAAVGTAAGSLLVTSCVGSESTAAATAVPLEQLPLGERVRVLFGETPVELIRSVDGVRARSLWCTHYGCEVVWSPEDEAYLCPCHDGVFDAEGRVVSGPPPRSLRRLTTRVENDTVYVEATDS